MLGFGRLLTAMVTPFDDDLKLDASQAGRLAKRLVESGSDGVVVAGTTGEAGALTRQEKMELFRAVVHDVGGQAAVIAGTGSSSTEESIELTKEAEKTGIDGVLLVAPYLSQPPQEGLYLHFKSIAAATRLPVMLYNAPGRTGVNLEPETMGRLAAIENIVAIKEAGGDLAQAIRYHAATPRGFAIYSGNDELALPMVASGAAGIVSVAAQLVGRRMKEMIEAAYAGKLEIASRINLELAPLFRALSLTSNPIMVKSALNILGLKVGRPRPPLVEAVEGELAVLRESMRGLGQNCRSRSRQ